MINPIVKSRLKDVARHCDFDVDIIREITNDNDNGMSDIEYREIHNLMIQLINFSIRLKTFVDY